jgi:hypothetical protein
MFLAKLVTTIINDIQLFLMAAKGQKNTTASKEKALANKWEKLSGEHFRSFQRVRQLADLMLQEALDRANERISNPSSFNEDSEEEELPPINPMAIVAWVKCLEVAIKGEREAMSMHLNDANIAIGRVQQLGFLVSRPDGIIDVDAKYVSED